MTSTLLPTVMPMSNDPQGTNPESAPVVVCDQIAPMNVSERIAMKNRKREANNGRSPLDGKQIEKLIDQGFTRGLAQSLNDMKRGFPLRYWVIDNSGSMDSKDGHLIVSPTSSLTKADNQTRIVTKSCSRWEELAECVKYHIELAGLLEAPTIFRFLNKPSAASSMSAEFSVARDQSTIAKDVANGLRIMGRMGPGGGTPLKSHILQIRSDIMSMLDQLLQDGQRVVITIATDGKPTDTTQQGFVECLRQLEGLPVWVVIRLCTDNDDVVQFYNDLDEQLELSIEVLDDFQGEALEVTTENPWVNYTLPLHRLREFGYHDRVFDLLDERPLTKSEIRDYCSLLFHDTDGMPDPSLEWKRFLEHVAMILGNESTRWNPVVKKATPWILTNKLNRIHRKGGALSSLRKKMTRLMKK